MKVLFDTSVYISFIRNRSHSLELQRPGSIKYLSAVVLMELWAGAKSKKAKKLIHHLQKPYLIAGRIVTPGVNNYIAMGQIFADLPARYDALVTNAGFLNDLQIAFAALSIGAFLYTEDKARYQIIKARIPSLKVEYV